MYSHEFIPGRHECYGSCRQVSCSCTPAFHTNFPAALAEAPLLQPHEVISLQAFGIGGREINRGTIRPSRFIHPISVTGGKSFCHSVLEVEEARPYLAPPQLSFPFVHECSAKSAAYDVALRTELSPLVPITLHRRSTN